jgi:hypothetical protein
MKQLFTEDEFINAKYGTKFPCECYECKQTFYTTKGIITNIKNKNYTNPKTQPKGKYCSSKCATNSRIRKIKVNCKECGIEFEKYPSAIKRTKNNFCTPSCATKYNNINRVITNNHRSKLERYLEERLIILFPQLDFHFNRKDAINSELDIYIPSLKLAFELNGIFHYEPIFGENKLNKTQNNDNRKYQACVETGIGLCIIDTSEQKYFKEKTSQKYLNIIIDIINQTLESN